MLAKASDRGAISESAYNSAMTDTYRTEANDHPNWKSFEHSEHLDKFFFLHGS
jgi:hypothetical protein